MQQCNLRIDVSLVCEVHVNIDAAVWRHGEATRRGCRVIVKQDLGDNCWYLLSASNHRRAVGGGNARVWSTVYGGSSKLVKAKRMRL